MKKMEEKEKQEAQKLIDEKNEAKMKEVLKKVEPLVKDTHYEKALQVLMDEAPACKTRN